MDARSTSKPRCFATPRNRQRRRSIAALLLALAAALNARAEVPLPDAMTPVPAVAPRPAAAPPPSSPWLPTPLFGDETAAATYPVCTDIAEAAPAPRPPRNRLGLAVALGLLAAALLRGREPTLGLPVA
jgi:hypothetical protein